MKQVLYVILCSIPLAGFCQNLKTVKIIDELNKSAVDKAYLINANNLADTLSSNYLGFIQLKANDGDSAIIIHPKYETTYFVIPQDEGFLVRLKLKKEHIPFDGGIKTFYSQLSKSLKYPNKQRLKKLEATKYIQFSLNENGKISNIKDLDNESCDPFCREISRALTQIKKGFSVDYAGSKFIVPVHFVLGANQIPAALGNKHVDKGRMLSTVTVKSYSYTFSQIK